MRLSSIVAAALGVLASLGCQKSKEEIENLRAYQTNQFIKALDRHFSQLNNQGHERKEDMLRMRILHERNPGFPKPTGTTYNTFQFDTKVVMRETGEYRDDGSPITVPMVDPTTGEPVVETAYIAENFECKIPGCGTKLMITVPAELYLCPSCGHSPYNEDHDPDQLHITPCQICVGDNLEPNAPISEQIGLDGLNRLAGRENVKPMFQLYPPTEDKPIEAVVRYIRRSWHYDERGTVTASTAALNAASIVDPSWLPAADGIDWSKPGYHRLDSTFVGEIVFVFQGGQLVQKGQAKETPVRPWKDIKIPH